jgi:hypothetical protein
MRPHFSRYSLRTMLIAVALVALAIGWWIRPRSIELRRDDGTLAARVRLKRDWRGELIGCGVQSWFLADGQCFRQRDSMASRSTRRIFRPTRRRPTTWAGWCGTGSRFRPTCPVAKERGFRIRENGADGTERFWRPIDPAGLYSPRVGV